MGGGNIHGRGGIVAGEIGSPLDDTNHISKDLKIINAGHIILGTIDLTHNDTGGTPNGCDIESTGTVHIHGDLTGPRDFKPGDGNASGYLKVTAQAIFAGAVKTHNRRSGKDIGPITLTALFADTLTSPVTFDTDATSNSVVNNAIHIRDGIFTKNPTGEGGSGNATTITLTSVALVMDDGSTMSTTDGDNIVINVGEGLGLNGPHDNAVNDIVVHSDYAFLRVDVGTIDVNYPGYVGLGAPFCDSRNVQPGDETAVVQARQMVNTVTVTSWLESWRENLQVRPRWGERVLRNEISEGELIIRDYLKLDNAGKTGFVENEGTLVATIDALGPGTYEIELLLSNERHPINDITVEGATVLTYDGPTSGGNPTIGFPDQVNDGSPVTATFQIKTEGNTSKVDFFLWSSGEGKIHSILGRSLVPGELVPAELSEFLAF
jgi:hypothetical protein